MSIKELYYFAINHSLLNEDVNKVIIEFNKVNSNTMKPKESLNLDKVEYTFDDLMALFSN